MCENTSRDSGRLNCYPRKDFFMLTYFIVIAANLLIGGMIGLTGIAGFLLPILYSGFMDMPAVQALALSFFAFLISGILGSWNYYKAKNLDLKLALLISAGSLAGAAVGVRLNLLIDEAVVKRILYTVVLLSGISILLRKEKAAPAEETHSPADKRNFSANKILSAEDKTNSSVDKILSPGNQTIFSVDKKTSLADQISAPADSKTLPVFLYPLFGLVTGAVCALSGAGGPVLVMPLLVLMGVPVKTAVGIALFDSIFIAIPSCIGYTMQCDLLSIGGLLAVSMVSHGVGVWVGSHNTAFLKPEVLKKGVAVFSVVIAVLKLITG